jgi:light-regulated signal transduction histidine kinase (bacteriophytochrome)
VLGDASLLVQLFQNLLGNGMKFRRDGVPPEVHVSAERDGGEWQLTCRDNGIGIEPQYAEKIFVIFQRLHSREAYGGTGIGLAMCRKIVEHHGGRMWLDEDATEGATFHWTMPVMSGKAAGPDGPPTEEREHADDGDASQPAGHGAAGGGRPR